MLADTTKTKKAQDEGDSGTLSSDIKASSSKSRTKNTNYGSTTITNKGATAMELDEATSDYKFLVPIGSKWSDLSDQLAKISANMMLNKSERSEELQELMACAPVLREEDMDVYGVTPSTDPLTLVVCAHCSKAVKSSRFLSHTELCQTIKDLPAEDTTNKRKVPETISRPPKRPLHDLQTTRPAANLGSPENPPPRLQKLAAAAIPKPVKVKPARPTLLRTADGRFAPMNKLKKSKSKLARNKKPVESKTPEEEEEEDEEESNAPRTPEYDRDDDATVPTSDPPHPSPSPSDDPSPSPATANFYIPPAPPLPSPSRTLLISSNGEGPVPLATRNFARPNKLRRIIVSLVPSVLIQQKQQLCTIYHEQPINTRTPYTSSSYSSSVNYSAPYLYQSAKEEKIESNIATSGNFPNKAATMSPLPERKKLLQKKPPDNSSSPLNQMKKKRKSDEIENGVPSAEGSPSPLTLSPTLRSQNSGQNLGLSQNLGPGQNLQNSGTQVRILKNNSQTNLHSNSVNLSNSGQDVNTNAYVQGKSPDPNNSFTNPTNTQTQQQVQLNQQMLANANLPTAHPTNLSPSVNAMRKPTPPRTSQQTLQPQQQQSQQVPQQQQQTQQLQAQQQTLTQTQPPQPQPQQQKKVPPRRKPQA